MSSEDLDATATHEENLSAAGKAVMTGIDQGVGLGIDIVAINRMERILERTPSFPEKVFSPDERAYCDSTAHRATHYATRFAAKEAVLKALGTGFSQGIGPRDVEVVRNAKGRPHVALTGMAARLAAEMGVTGIPVSLSYTHNDAVACAMVITKENVRAMEERVDPMKELQKKFKEARGLLDDLPVTGAAPAKGEATVDTPVEETEDGQR